MEVLKLYDMEALKLYDSHGNIVDEASEFPFGVMQANPSRRPQLGDMVIYLDPKPRAALIVDIFAGDEVLLHVYKSDPQDTCTEFSTYSEANEPGTWHFRQQY